MIINENTQRKIFPVASGKGGVGKSVLVSNLGVSLASFGQRTVLVDLDLGGSNLHTYLGMKNRHRGIGNFISDKSVSFADVKLKTPYPNLEFIPGDVLVPGTANMTHAQKRSVLKHIEKIDADYILLDLGSGSHFTTLDFFLMSNSGFIVTTPQAPAILNAYGFLKNAAFRLLQQTFSSHKGISHFLTEIVKEQQPNSTPSIGKIIEGISKINKQEAQHAYDEIGKLRPSIIVSMGDRPEDMEIVQSLRALIEQNLSIEPLCLGFLYYDYIVREAVSDTVPLALVGRDSLILREIDRLAQKIVHSERFPEMPLDLNEYDDSFELAAIEAEEDYKDINPHPHTRVDQQPDEASAEEFIRLITAQKQEIKELQSTVRALTLQQQQNRGYF
ncbi:MAG: P-loop NTPase [Spirochaetales bacterium]